MPGQPIVDIRNSFGAAFVGLIISTMLFGWTMAQTWFYFWNYRNRDSKQLKFFVAFVTFMDALHMIMCTYAIYWYLILNFGNVESLMDSMWAMNLQVILSVIVGSSVQFYYARRVYILSRSIILPILIVVVVVVGSGAGLYLTARAFALKRFSGVHTFWPSYITLGAVALADGLVAASMCWSLYRRRTGFAKTDSIILTLMAYSINSGLLTGILGITATICFIILPTNMVWLAFSWAMSKCYVNSLLAMLNSRDYIRDRRDQSDSGNPDNAYHLSSMRVGKLSASEAAVCVSVHRSTTLDYGRNKSDHDEATFEVTKPNATIVPLKSKAQTPESSA
ncbi:hypothetical protein EDB92DRAFT_882118 [Lactarius akahatsu]|uniref:DUF6534 domain-containing protein n=1 Tax=Lactarius akahatsu TaxID=416441 RepID=A0AAD4LDC7_9AGAM|nr:hypothetical protein EDB92DRAFT_882118 [Lactarius akahatsu]